MKEKDNGERERERWRGSGGLHPDCVNDIKAKQIPLQRLLFIARRKINFSAVDDRDLIIVIIERSYKIVKIFYRKFTVILHDI